MPQQPMTQLFPPKHVDIPDHAMPMVDMNRTMAKSAPSKTIHPNEMGAMMAKQMLMKSK